MRAARSVEMKWYSVAAQSSAMVGRGLRLSPTGCSQSPKVKPFWPQVECGWMIGPSEMHQR